MQGKKKRFWNKSKYFVDSYFLLEMIFPFTMCKVKGLLVKCGIYKK